MVKSKSLSSVNYARSYQAERELPAALIGSSKWFSDLELLMEDNWPNIKNVPFSSSDSETIATSKLVLIEGTTEMDQVRLCIESTVPSSTKKVLLLKEDENAFIKRTYLNYAARLGISVVELPSDPAAAAAELSGLLSSLLGQVKTEIEEDITRAELVVDGFEIQRDIVEIKYLKWSDRCEKVLSWIFPVITMGTMEYRLLRLLAKAQPLFSTKSTWPHSVNETLLPLESFAKTLKIKDYLFFTVSLAEKVTASSEIKENDALEIIDKSNLGMLTKRALKKSIQALTSSASSNINSRKAS